MRDALDTGPINPAAPLDPESARHVGGRSWERKPDGTIHIGRIPRDATGDKPDPRLDNSRYPRVEAVEAYGPPRDVIRGKAHHFEQGPLGFHYRCPGCQRDHFNSLRYPLPRIVCCASGVCTIVTPPAESIDTGDWDRHGRFGTAEEPGDD